MIRIIAFVAFWAAAAGLIYLIATAANHERRGR